ncbi:MAG: hypothetical protein ACLR5S_06885 [Ruminococcus sp.]
MRYGSVPLALKRADDAGKADGVLERREARGRAENCLNSCWQKTPACV